MNEQCQSREASSGSRPEKGDCSRKEKGAVKWMRIDLIDRMWVTGLDRHSLFLQAAPRVTRYPAAVAPDLLPDGPHLRP